MSLPLGSTHPALRRLAKEGLARKEEPEARKKRPFAITETGRKTLEQIWGDTLRDVDADAESILRIVTLFELLGNSDEKRDCHYFLEGAAGDRLTKSGRRQLEAERLRTDTREPLYLHRWMRAKCDVSRLKGEGEAFKHIAAFLASKENDDGQQHST